MEKLDYRELVKKVIQQYASDRSELDTIETHVVFDPEHVGAASP